jgi:hypothetical protein
MAISTPSNGLDIANQKERFQPSSCAIEFAFTPFSQAFEDRYFRKSEGSCGWLLVALPISLDADSQGELYQNGGRNAAA